MKKKIYLSLEFLFIFFLLPLGIYYYDLSLNRLVIPILLSLSIFCLFILFKDRSFDNKTLYKISSNKGYLRKIFVRWSVGAVILTITMYLFQNNLFFALPKMNTKLWIAVIILYPLLSVYPQEIIFRSYFFHRYRTLFSSKILIILFSGIVFGVAHLFFQNWIAPVLSAIGGILFANTYSKTGSLPLAVIEHSLWGDLIFTVGLGFYFYSGNNL